MSERGLPWPHGAASATDEEAGPRVGMGRAGKAAGALSSSPTAKKGSSELTPEF